MTQRTGDWLSGQLGGLRIKLERPKDAPGLRRPGLGVTKTSARLSSASPRKPFQPPRPIARSKKFRYEMVVQASAETRFGVLDGTSGSLAAGIIGRCPAFSPARRTGRQRLYWRAASARSHNAKNAAFRSPLSLLSGVLRITSRQPPIHSRRNRIAPGERRGTGPT